ncbi:MAG: tRNA glutamyl-Q(34) synthetase GluQRS [Burkholderiales bacterium]|nr:MAG: tRNA glutamyl-Q(34) synthetase GluQRS [Burkholderiales bacterium]
MREPASYRGRFAPSPTGPLHFGSLLAAMASYADARAAGGQWLLRIEDLDPPREQPGAACAILATLKAYGFAWDGEVAYQSQRGAPYAAALQDLQSRGLAFPCACTRAELQASPLGPGAEPIYPGNCRKGLPPGRAGRAWRVRVDETRVRFDDLLQGPVFQDLAHEVGDFVIRRADGWFAYHLAVVVDDAAQGITHVVRGADLLSSTPRQIYLQRLLGLPTPQYLHIPVATSVSGEKLSKQTLAPALPERDPMPQLRAAWSFLGQLPPPDCAFAEFWPWAFAHWERRRLPACAGRAIRFDADGRPLIDHSDGAV